MTRLRALIADDAEPMRRRLRSLLVESGAIEVVGECADGRQAVLTIPAQAPDLLILDVQLPVLDGFGVLEALEPEQTPAVIFVTDYEQHTLRAFEAHQVDYLLKPFDRASFRRTLARAVERVQTRSIVRFGPHLLTLLAELSPHRGPLERVSVKRDGRVLFFKTDEIDWIDCRGNYAVLHIGGTPHFLRQRLKELERRLSPSQFVRLHRSAIVNISRVVRSEPRSRGRSIVVMSDGTILPTSLGYVDRLQSLQSHAIQGQTSPPAFARGTDAQRASARRRRAGPSAAATLAADGKAKELPHWNPGADD